MSAAQRIVDAWMGIDQVEREAKRDKALRAIKLCCPDELAATGAPGVLVEKARRDLELAETAVIVSAEAAWWELRRKRTRTVRQWLQTRPANQWDPALAARLLHVRS